MGGRDKGNPPVVWGASRGRIVLRVIVVAALFHLVYWGYLSKQWAYLGYVPIAANAWGIARTYLLVVWPALLLPLRSTRRTILVFFILYNVFYVPSEFCLLSASVGWDRALPIQVTLALGFGLVALSFRLRAPSIRMAPVSLDWFIWAMVTLCGLVLALVLSVGLSRLTFASFFDASGTRRAMEEAGGLLTRFGAGYLMAWVTYVVAPVLVLIGLMQKRALLVCTGCLAEMAVYASTAAKFALLTVPFVVAAWYICRKGPVRAVVKYVYWGSGLLFAVTLVANALLGVPNRIEQVLSYFVMRYFGYQGLSTVVYAKFAEANGYTYWSHVTGVSAFVTYPFTESIPWAVASYWLKTTGTSAPSHPWAQDGLAAAGLGGVLLISPVVAGVFWLTDSLTARARSEVLVPLLMIQGILLSESSLFTQLVSNGWLLACMLMWIAPTALRRAFGDNAPGRTGVIREANHQ